MSLVILWEIIFATTLNPTARFQQLMLFFSDECEKYLYAVVL